MLTKLVLRQVMAVAAQTIAELEASRVLVAPWEEVFGCVLEPFGLGKALFSWMLEPMSKSRS